MLHGGLQVGYNGSLAPLCFGSHYALRTKALRAIGGLGPGIGRGSFNVTPTRSGIEDEDAFAAFGHFPVVCFRQNVACGPEDLHKIVFGKRVDPTGAGATYRFLESTYRSWSATCASV